MWLQRALGEVRALAPGYWMYKCGQVRFSVYWQRQLTGRLAYVLTEGVRSTWNS